MRKLNRIGLIAAFSALGALALPAVEADAMTVQPVVIDLQTAGRGMTQVVTVQNTSTVPLPVELTVDQLAFGPEGMTVTGKDPGDLLVFPREALIRPGRTQAFRVQYVGDPALASSKHYYMTVGQLPVEMPGANRGIQVLYNFQILVSVGPRGVKPDLKVVSAEVGRNEAGCPTPVITLRNDSAAYGYLSRGKLLIVARDASGREVYRRTIPGPEIQQTIGYGLVTSGQTRRLVLPLTLPPETLPTEGGAVEGRFTPDRRP
ncbi:MAG: molecular chaperone [Caulobacter sp.]|nr:molecular chaperone [Caulobacter sp.]